MYVLQHSDVFLAYIGALVHKEGTGNAQDEEGLLNVEYPVDEGKKEGRQASILQLLEQNFYVSIEEISELFSVTAQTARRDILALEKAGKVRRLHGGAAIVAPLAPTVYHRRRVDNVTQKERIGRLAADLVPDGSTIFLDSGTTCEAIARALLNHNHLRIVTYSLRVATILNENPEFTLAVPGGFVRPVHGGIFQGDAPDFIRRFKFDHAIISVSGIDNDGDICDDDHAESQIVASAMAQTGHIMLAVDSSKFGKRAMVRLGTIAEIGTLVTDQRPDDELHQLLERNRVQVLF